MGAWSFVQPLLASILPKELSVRYVGRIASASPATGNASVHKRELEALLEEALAK
jgi:2-oxoglutarate dehydrogenase E1 component